MLPALNVQCAAAAAFLMGIALHVLASHGITYPPDVANGMTGFVAILIAHICDMATGDTKK
jgi:hypothetical protein